MHGTQQQSQAPKNSFDNFGQLRCWETVARYRLQLVRRRSNLRRIHGRSDCRAGYVDSLRYQEGIDSRGIGREEVEHNLPPAKRPEERDSDGGLVTPIPLLPSVITSRMSPPVTSLLFDPQQAMGVKEACLCPVGRSVSADWDEVFLQPWHSGVYSRRKCEICRSERLGPSALLGC